MRIIAVTTWFPTEQAPSRGSFVLRDVRALQSLHDVRLVHLVPPADDDGTRRLTHEGVEVLRIPMNPADPASVARAAARLRHALAGAQLVHSMAFSSLEPLSLARPDVPWVHTEHWSALTNPETLGRAGRAALPALSRLLALPDVVTTVCDYLARPVRAVRGERPTRVVPCIVEPYDPAPRRPRRDGRLELVSVGGLIDRKDPLLAVRTVAELASRDVDAHLAWAGEGPLRDEVLALASELGVTERVRLLGTLDREGVREALAAADLFLGPTKGDNFFVSAAEAVIAGRPVVVGTAGGQDEYLTRATARLVDSREAAAWADAVIDLDAAALSTSAEEISASIGDAFSSPVVAAGYHRVYREALAPRTEGWS